VPGFTGKVWAKASPDALPSLGLETLERFAMRSYTPCGIKFEAQHSGIALIGQPSRRLTNQCTRKLDLVLRLATPVLGPVQVLVISDVMSIQVEFDS